MTITKLQAGTAQLKEAVFLFFERRDPLAIHTLAGAASSILYDLANHRGITSPVRGNPLVRDDKRNKWINFINQSQNFLKHADRNPDEELDFDPAMTEMLIFEGVALLDYFFTERLPWANVFATWFSVKHPDLVVNPRLAAFTANLPLDVDDYVLICRLLALAESDPSALLASPPRAGACGLAGGA